MHLYPHSLFSTLPLVYPIIPKPLKISTPQIRPLPLPIDRPFYINDILQSLPHLYNPTPNHTRINCYCFPHELLHFG